MLSLTIVFNKLYSSRKEIKRCNPAICESFFKPSSDFRSSFAYDLAHSSAFSPLFFSRGEMNTETQHTAIEYLPLLSSLSILLLDIRIDDLSRQYREWDRRKRLSGSLEAPELVRDEMKGVFNISPHKLLPLCCLVVLILLFYVGVIISCCWTMQFCIVQR